MTFAVLRVQKLKGTGKIRVAAAHNRRTIQAEIGASCHIDPARISLNVALYGAHSPEAIAANAEAKMQAAGITKLRKDAVRAIEVIISLPAGHTIKDTQFFDDAACWLAACFGGMGNLLSADIHRDEAAPHCHVLLLPLIGGRMVGSDALGGKTKLRKLQTDFYEQVALAYGLQRPKPKLHGTAKNQAAQAVLQRLQQLADPTMQGAVWQVVRDCIKRDPSDFMQALGLAHTPTKKLRSLAATFTSKGKGSQSEA